MLPNPNEVCADWAGWAASVVPPKAKAGFGGSVVVDPKAGVDVDADAPNEVDVAGVAPNPLD